MSGNICRCAAYPHIRAAVRRVRDQNGTADAARWLLPGHDEVVNPLGTKGVGEIGVVGAAAAIANAVHDATGRRQYELPITLEKLL